MCWEPTYVLGTDKTLRKSGTAPAVPAVPGASCLHHNDNVDEYKYFIVYSSKFIRYQVISCEYNQ